MAEFPLSLIYQPGELDSRSSSPGRVYAKLLIQLEHLQNLFVADRLLLRRGDLDQGDLLLTSFEMVSLTLLFWTNKDRFALARPDFAWLVSPMVLWDTRSEPTLTRDRSWPMPRPQAASCAWSCSTRPSPARTRATPRSRARASSRT